MHGGSCEGGTRIEKRWEGKEVGRNSGGKYPKADAPKKEWQVKKVMDACTTQKDVAAWSGLTFYVGKDEGMFCKVSLISGVGFFVAGEIGSRRCYFCGGGTYGRRYGDLEASGQGGSG
ncbi:hypothetical protein VNO78_31530 [Psophocarpus tetragonolobus]|uniref:Uncharacterized protein n=1 Tax=Psophocarpus tetragonolobus TaxID=3891 RepID=A0AAN9RZ30_PSOTE